MPAAAFAAAILLASYIRSAQSACVYTPLDDAGGVVGDGGAAKEPQDSNIHPLSCVCVCACVALELLPLSEELRKSLTRLILQVELSRL